MSNHLPSRRQTLTAAALRVDSKRINREYVSTRPWQAEAWDFYDLLGPLRYAARYDANAMSRASLVAARTNPEPGGQPIPLPSDHPAQQVMDRFLGGDDARASAIQRLGVQLYVSGISYLVHYKEGNTRAQQDKWRVVSSDELSVVGDEFKIQIGESEHITLRKRDVMLMRIWTPHARRWWVPDSPVRGVMVELRELAGFAQAVGATIDSRLAGAGMITIPSELTFESTRDDVPEGIDPFIWDLTKGMLESIRDRDQASAVVPLAVKGPAEYLDSIRHIRFDTQFDENTPELRNDAMKRLAIGLDLPPEVLLGMGDLNHWGSWQVDESAIKLHIEPKLAAICAATSEAYLRPVLRQMQLDGDVSRDFDVDEIVCWYDTTPLKLRPNRAEDAGDLHTDLLITDEARRKASGFTEADSPQVGSDEWLVMLLRTTLVNQPQYLPEILPVLGKILGNDYLANIDLTPRGDDGQNNGRSRDAEDKSTPKTKNRTKPDNGGRGGNRNDPTASDSGIVELDTRRSS